MNKLLKILISTFSVILVIFLGLLFINKDQLFNQSPALSTGGYEIKGALVYQKDFADAISPIIDHYEQTLAINVDLVSLESNSLNQEILNQLDFLHIHDSVTDDSLKISEIKKFIKTGGTVIVGADVNNKELHKLAGIKGNKQITLNQDSELSVNTKDDNLKALSELGYYFMKHNLDWGKEDLTFNGLEVKDKQSVLEISEGPIVAKKEIGKGKILILSDLFLDYKNYITGYDFKDRDENNGYYSFFHSTFNQKSIDALLEYISLEKYGVAFFKTQGPYGRPALAWQNHYEVLDSIKNKEAIVWGELLKKENQVPTISLVRGSYNWGEWYGTISLHENSGSNETPIFIGEELDSFYSFGTKLKNTDGAYLTFGQLEEYRSYYEKFATNHRTYPQFIDWNNDGTYDLVVGTSTGELLLYLNENGKFKPVGSLYEGNINLGTQLAVAIENDQFLVGNEDGYIYELSGYNKEKNAFTEASPLSDAQGLPIKTDAMAAPALGDLNNDGQTDLVIGNGSGNLIVYLTTEDGYKLTKTINESLGENLAPHIGDYNSDGHNDLLVGNQAGDIHIFINNGDMNFPYNGKIKTERKNIYGENTIYTGKNVVPVIVDFDNDGVNEIVTGELSFSLTYDISSEHFAYKQELGEIIQYLQDNYIPILPHLYSHSYKDDALEKEEYARHKEVFKQLGIPWDYAGTNQHTWRVNFDNPTQSFNNQMAVNIYYNFAFRTPNNPATPTFGLNYLWPNLWLYENDQGFMAMSTPSPMITMFEGVHKELAQLELPIIFFEHIENKVYNRELAPSLEKMIAEINHIRDNYNYVFLTEDQMAQSFINNIKTNYDINIQSDKISITRDMSDIPEELTSLYSGTNGIKAVFSKNAPEFYTDELIQYRQDNELYIGFLNESVELTQSIQSTPIYNIQASNSPLIVTGNTITINNYGMKQVVIVSEKPLNITGEQIEVIEKDRYKYEITHWGEPVDITISVEDK